MKGTLFSLILLLSAAWLGPVRADEVASATGATIKHSSTLRFLKGSYTSIFGIVPKKYTLESEETREIQQTVLNDQEFKLSLTASNTRRILSIEGETPTVETASKPLTGKSLRAFKSADGWSYEILDQSEVSEEEKKEAQRLVSRFQPGASPFQTLNWTSEGTATLEPSALLRFLGYPQANNLQGSAQVRKPVGGEKTPAALEFTAAFEAGEKLGRIVVEIKGKGTVALAGSAWGYERVTIEGDLTIHGQRELPDGRKVPYSLVTPFSYETAVAPVTAPKS